MYPPACAGPYWGRTGPPRLGKNRASGKNRTFGYKGLQQQVQVFREQLQHHQQLLQQQHFRLSARSRWPRPRPCPLPRPPVSVPAVPALVPGAGLRAVQEDQLLLVQELGHSWSHHDELTPCVCEVLGAAAGSGAAAAAGLW